MTRALSIYLSQIDETSCRRMRASLLDILASTLPGRGRGATRTVVTPRMLSANRCGHVQESYVGLVAWCMQGGECWNTLGFAEGACQCGRTAKRSAPGHRRAPTWGRPGHACWCRGSARRRPARAPAPARVPTPGKTQSASHAAARRRLRPSTRTPPPTRTAARRARTAGRRSRGPPPSTRRRLRSTAPQTRPAQPCWMRGRLGGSRR